MVEVEPLLTRRAALRTGAGVAATALTGCGVEAGSPRAGGPSPSPDAEADLPLLERALRREERVRLRVRHASRRQPRLRADLRRVGSVHDDHVTVLSRSLPTHTPLVSSDESPPRSARETVEDLARSERTLADAHAQAALDARSGPFARVLAGMAAAADQQASVLDGLASVVPRRG